MLKPMQCGSNPVNHFPVLGRRRSHLPSSAYSGSGGLAYGRTDHKTVSHPGSGTRDQNRPLEYICGGDIAELRGSGSVNDHSITDYHAKLYAYQLTQRVQGDQPDRLTTSIMDSSVDLNPHQIDAALFAFSWRETHRIYSERVKRWFRPLPRRLYYAWVIRPLIGLAVVYLKAAVSFHG